MLGNVLECRLKSVVSCWGFEHTDYSAALIGVDASGRGGDGREGDMGERKCRPVPVGGHLVVSGGIILISRMYRRVGIRSLNPFHMPTPRQSVKCCYIHSYLIRKTFPKLL